MPSMPPRKPPTAPQRPSSPPPQGAVQEDAVPDESFLSFGSQATARIKTSQEANAFRGFREFFITKKEMAAEKAKSGNLQVEARVHFIRNYANVAENVSVPRCTILEAGNYSSYTSAGPDCALAAAGAPVSVRPVYVLIDHRSYSRKDGTVSTDEVKLWVPAPTMLGIMQNAIRNLAENLQCEPSAVDITKYEAKISKMGEGRSTTWAINFSLAPRALSKVAVDAIAKTFGERGYKQTMMMWLAPNPKFLISRGGSYVMPRKGQSAGPTPASDDEPPF